MQTAIQQTIRHCYFQITNAVDQLQRNKTENCKYFPLTRNLIELENVKNCWLTVFFNDIFSQTAGIDALSLFGAQFFTTIDKLRAECDIARNQELMELEQVKKDNEEFEVELQRLFPSKNNSEETEYEKVIVLAQHFFHRELNSKV